mgnify:CR=1 FL=1
MAGQKLQADLVVDASGRSSHATEWLEQLGYNTPRETVINARIGYATRLYPPPANRTYDWKTLLVRGNPPEDSRSGLIFPLEGGRWIALMVGAGDQAPPTDEAGFTAFARNLPSPQIADALAPPSSGVDRALAGDHGLFGRSSCQEHERPGGMGKLNHLDERIPRSHRVRRTTNGHKFRARR